MRECAEPRLDDFFDGATDLLAVLDREARLTRVNPAWGRALGCDVGALVGRDVAALVHPDDAEHGREVVRRAQAGATLAPLTSRFRSRDGGHRFVAWHDAWPAADGSIHVVAVDVTLLRRLQAQRAQTEQQSGVGAWEVDLEVGFVEWSPMTYAIHELDPGAWRPRVDDALDYYPPEARAVLGAAVKRVMEEGVGYDLELPFVTAKGRSIWVHTTAAVELRDGKPVRVYGTFADVTAERERRLQLERLGEIARRTINLVSMLDAEGRFVWVNEAFERLSGYTANEVLGRYPGEVLRCAETDPRVVAALDAAIRNGQAIRTEVQNAGKGGQRRWWGDLDLQPIHDANGRLDGFIVVETDVTARKAQAAALAAATEAADEARTRLLQAVEVLPDALVYYDAEDRLVLCNQRYCDFYPKSAAAMVPGTRFEDILRYGLDRRQYRAAIGREEAWLQERLAAHRLPESRLEQQLDDGRWLRVLEKATGDGGRISMRMDITELKRAEQRLADIIRGARVGTWEWNVQTGEIVINDRWAEIVGRRVEDLQPTTIQTWIDHSHPDDLATSNELLQRHFAGELEFYECEVRMRHADGRWVLVHDRGRVATWTPDGKPEWVSGVHLDVTEQRVMEERLRQSQRLEAIGQLTGGVAHDFNNLLTVIVGNAELMADRLGADDPLRPLVAMTRTAAERGASLTKSLLAFARRQPLDARPVDVGEVLRGMGEMLRRTLGEQIALRVETAPEPWLARVDAAQLESAVLNLSLNARDAMPDGGQLRIVTENVRLRADEMRGHSEAVPGDYVRLSVEDDGAGIDGATQARVFEPFFTTKGPGKGTGLGLSMVYGYVTQLGGHVVLDSAPGQGTIVCLFLPRAVENAAGPPTPDVATIRGDGETVLMVEDDPLVRAHVAELLRHLGYRVVTAIDGPDALRKLREESRIDLLFTDVVMPGGMNGRQLAEHALALRPGLPVLLTSGYTADALPDDGHGDLLPLLKKPYRRDELATKLRQVIAARGCSGALGQVADEATPSAQVPTALAVGSGARGPKAP